MKTNELFQKAIKDKNLSSLAIFDRNENGIRKQYLQVSIKRVNKYSVSDDSEYIYSDTLIKYEDYSGNNTIQKAIDNNRLKLSTIISGYYPHLHTFLKAIKKESEVSFKVIAFNSCENWKNVNFVSHQIYGIVDNNYYFLESFVGPDNIGSPINY